MSEKIEMKKKGYKEPAFDSKDIGDCIQVRVIVPNYRYDSRTCCKLKGTKCPNAISRLTFPNERSFKLTIDPYEESSSPLDSRYQLEILKLFDFIVPDPDLIDKEQDGVIILRLKKLNGHLCWKDSLKDGLETEDPELMTELK
ncbi:DgyrCDS1088 [Dimorphilus gyrociliatus]|uniref:DgyrCDS1088 n=1 Tax=Dimorphilus gyrociliatus TaxID=2664684 RepID=A0A7I8VBB0_9ANNE|nr:DgyrCDS1088 [Dimorphilus gyrociliatus]